MQITLEIEHAIQLLLIQESACHTCQSDLQKYIVQITAEYICPSHLGYLSVFCKAIAANHFRNQALWWPYIPKTKKMTKTKTLCQKKHTNFGHQDLTNRNKFVHTQLNRRTLTVQKVKLEKKHIFY